MLWRTFKLLPAPLALLGLALARGGSAPEATQVFDRHFTAVGGREAMASLKSATVHGTGRMGTNAFDFQLQLRAPGLLKLTREDASGETVCEARDARARFWCRDSQGVHDLAAERASQLTALALAFLPPGQLALGERLEDALCQIAPDDGRGLVAIGRTQTQAIFPRLLFDPRTGFLTQVGRTVLDDYRPAAPVRVPFLVRAGSNLIYAVRSVRFNEPMPDALFERPGAKGGFFSRLAPSMVPAQVMSTNLTASNRLGIVRQPEPARTGRGSLARLPRYDPDSGQSSQVDLRGWDLTRLDLRDRLGDVRHADFDSTTRWPNILPKEFDPDRISALGKDPGLGLRGLHAEGLTGRGVGIGIIDQPLLVNHREYAERLRLYEEIHCPVGARAQMHGPAVASIAVGRSCGVAPEAELYYIAEYHFESGAGGSLEFDFTWLAQSIHRLLDVNATLPSDRKLRVIAVSAGWGPDEKGAPEAMAAVERATRDRVFVLTTSVRQTHRLRFDGLGRDALADPNTFESYGPGSWWAASFWNGQMRFQPGKRLCVPMDSRTVAGPAGPDDYAHFANAGWSWSVPWIAGLYAVACQVCPDVSPERFWTEALRTGRTVRLRYDGEEVDFGTIADPAALIGHLRRSLRPALGSPPVNGADRDPSRRSS